jgi:hypothetical protein
VSWIPGWQTSAAAKAWSDGWFWASIGSLLLLGVCEVISHRYSERKDELDAENQRNLQRQHDNDVASLQLQAAKAIERAAVADQHAADANLALERYKAPRAITDADAEIMRKNLEAFSNTRIEIFLTSDISEVINIHTRIIQILHDAHWQPESWNLMGGSMAATGAVVLIKNGSGKRVTDVAQALTASLNLAGVPTNIVNPPAVWQNDWNALPGLANGPVWNPKGEHPLVRLVIGTKN